MCSTACILIFFKRHLGVSKTPTVQPLGYSSRTIILIILRRQFGCVWDTTYLPFWLDTDTMCSTLVYSSHTIILIFIWVCLRRYVFNLLYLYSSHTNILIRRRHHVFNTSIFFPYNHFNFFRRHFGCVWDATYVFDHLHILPIQPFWFLLRDTSGVSTALWWSIGYNLIKDGNLQTWVVGESVHYMAAVRGWDS